MKSTLQLLKAILLLLFTCLIIKNKTYSQSGTLDLNFGNGGKDTIGMYISNEPDVQKEKIHKLLIQKNQKIIAAGYVQNESPIDGLSAIALARYNSDGRLDSTFGNSGKVLEGFVTYCSDADLQSDDKIIAVGNVADTISGQGYPVLARFTKNGLLDSSFGKNGYLDTSGRISNIFWQTKVLNDNSIIVSGDDGNNPQHAARRFVEKYLPNGKIDSGFAINGRLLLNNDAVATTSNAIAIQHDNKIILFVNGSTSDTVLNKIIRLTPFGNYDLSFGDSGRIIVSKLNAANYSDTINDISSQLLSLTNDGKIITTGTNVYTKKGYIKKYNIDGSVDNSFGTVGKVWIDTNVINLYDKFIQSSMLIQQDNKIILSGLYSYTIDNPLPDFATVRFLSNGNLDGTFGNNGLTITDFGVDARSTCSALQKDNKLLLGGSCLRTNNDSIDYALENFALARYNNDVVLPVSLLSFNATKQQQSVLLNWQTANEINNNYFSIERSNNNKNFSEINKLQSTNNPSKINSYTTADLKPLNGWNYYRLKQVDKDGKFTYSSIASVLFNEKILITIYPNPARNFIYVDGLRENVQANILITDAKGKTLLTTETIQSSTKINIQNLSSGIYYISIKQDGKTIKQKFIKQ